MWFVQSGYGPLAIGGRHACLIGMVANVDVSGGLVVVISLAYNGCMNVQLLKI